MNLSNLPPVGTPEYWRAIRQLATRAQVDIDRLWGRVANQPWTGAPSPQSLPVPITWYPVRALHLPTGYTRFGIRNISEDVWRPAAPSLQFSSVNGGSNWPFCFGGSGTPSLGLDVSNITTGTKGVESEYTWKIGASGPERYAVKLDNIPSTRIWAGWCGYKSTYPSDPLVQDAMTMLDGTSTDYIWYEWDFCELILNTATWFLPSNRGTVGVGFRFGSTCYATADTTFPVAWATLTGQTISLTDTDWEVVRLCV